MSRYTTSLATAELPPPALVPRPRLTYGGPIVTAQLHHPEQLTAAASEEASTSPLSLAVAVLGAALFAIMLRGGAGQLVAGGYLFLLLAILAFLKPQVCVMATFVFLAILGDLRRLVIWDISAHFDPVLLVGPFVVMLLVALAYRTGRLSGATTISKLVIALMAVMIVQIFNPLQGGLIVGLAGGLYMLIPVMWFWVGKAWGSQRFIRTLLFRVVVPLGLAASLLGIWQAAFGLLPYQRAAFEELTHGRIVISGTQARPMSFFVSTSEYSLYIAFPIVVIGASVMFRKWGLSVVALPVVAVAELISGVRHPVAMSLIAMAVLWAVLGKSFASSCARLIMAGALGAAGLTWALHEAASMDLSPQMASLLQHQRDGLLNPTDERKSTAGGHIAAIPEGIMRGLREPWGHGLGFTSMAAIRFGGDIAGTEVDFADVFLSLGAIGGLIYLMIIFNTFKRAVQQVRQEKSFAAFLAMSVLCVGFFRWLYGGQYAAAALCFFCMGCIDRGSKSTQNADDRNSYRNGVE